MLSHSLLLQPIKVLPIKIKLNSIHNSHIFLSFLQLFFIIVSEREISEILVRDREMEKCHNWIIQYTKKDSKSSVSKLFAFVMYADYVIIIITNENNNKVRTRDTQDVKQVSWATIFLQFGSRSLCALLVLSFLAISISLHDKSCEENVLMRSPSRCNWKKWNYTMENIRTFVSYFSSSLSVFCLHSSVVYSRVAFRLLCSFFARRKKIFFGNQEQQLF